MRLLAVLCALALAGCLAEDPASPDGQEPLAEGAAMAAPAVNTTLERTFSGVILYRLVTSEETNLQYTGDPPYFCFRVPDNTTTLAGHLVWDEPEAMGLEFHDPEMKVVATSHPADEPSLQTQGPIDLVTKVHYPGEWFAYAGPGLVGADIHWTLTLTWTIARPASLSEVDPIRTGCGPPGVLA